VRTPRRGSRYLAVAPKARTEEERSAGRAAARDRDRGPGRGPGAGRPRSGPRSPTDLRERSRAGSHSGARGEARAARGREPVPVPAAPPPPPPRPEFTSGTMRLNKRMAELGMCSRREADDWIERGWVRVDGELARIGMQVTPQSKIEIDSQAEGERAARVTVLLNKPIGYVSGQAEGGHKPAVTLIKGETRWQEDRSRTHFHPRQLMGMAPAGRLDIDSTGLLVLTQDGRIARTLIGEDSEIEKEYLVRVSYDGIGERVSSVFPREKLALLRHGLELDEAKLKPAQVDWENPEQLRFVLTEGKKRQIRRMCELVGLRVEGLKRIRIGRVMLGNLPPGAWRYLAPNEEF